jgi:DNA replication licensing factor MCM4
MAEPSSNT